MLVTKNGASAVTAFIIHPKNTNKQMPLNVSLSRADAAFSPRYRRSIMRLSALYLARLLPKASLWLMRKCLCPAARKPMVHLSQH